MTAMTLVFGKLRYFRPVCIRHPHGFYAGPRFYEETVDRDAATLILKAVKEGQLPLWRAREELDRLENERQVE